ncbi:MAG: tetratricopeptide repeat protein [Deltaproteobacteria bacterium]|nr:MAG: tetratricopeptide repeat protein [Deltaproteobacteria bacterium]UCF46449.1 MAG: tetratricopeptide repeat protein [Myxococcales bacterium]
MSTGSKESSEESPLGQARLRSQGLGLRLSCCFTILFGCNYAALHQGTDLQAQLASITPEDLFSLAVSHARSGDLLRAEQYLSAARQRGHDESEVVYWLVRVCVASSRYQSALAHATDYLRDHPSDWSLRLVVATIYEALGDVARAQSELERIVTAEPRRPLPHYRLAMLYRKQAAGQEQATAHLEEYLQLTPDGPHAAEVRSALSEVTETSTGPRLIPYPRTIVSGKEAP